MHNMRFITLHVQRELGKVMGVGDHVIINAFMFVDPKRFESYLAIDSPFPFQTFPVRLLVVLID